MFVCGRVPDDGCSDAPAGVPRLLRWRFRQWSGSRDADSLFRPYSPFLTLRNALEEFLSEIDREFLRPRAHRTGEGRRIGGRECSIVSSIFVIRTTWARNGAPAWRHSPPLDQLPEGSAVPQLPEPLPRVLHIEESGAQRRLPKHASAAQILDDRDLRVPQLPEVQRLELAVGCKIPQEVSQTSEVDLVAGESTGLVDACGDLECAKIAEPVLSGQATEDVNEMGPLLGHVRGEHARREGAHAGGGECPHEVLGKGTERLLELVIRREAAAQQAERLLRSIMEGDDVHSDLMLHQSAGALLRKLDVLRKDQVPVLGHEPVVIGSDPHLGGEAAVARPVVPVPRRPTPAPRRT